MKLYSRMLLLFYFGITIILLSMGSLVEFAKKYYPILKRELRSFAKKGYGAYSKKSPYRGLSAV